MSAARKSIEGGYCQQPDTAGCALTRLDCDDPTNFLSARQMQGGEINAHFGTCRWQDTVQNTVLGRCRTSAGTPTECASEVQACPGLDSGFLAKEFKECTVGSTAFGRCDNSNMCAWSRDQCSGNATGDDWEPFDKNCSCDQVQVGACSNLNANTGEQEYYCAVSEDACDNEQLWITPQDVKGAAGYDCFLCREGYKGSGVSANNKVNNIPSNSNNGSVAAPVYSSFNNNSSSNNTNSNNNTVLITIAATLGAVLTIAIISLVTWRCMSNRRASKAAIEASINGKPPAATISISSNPQFGQFASDPYAQNGEPDTLDDVEY